jgi:hypothetical protein
VPIRDWEDKFESLKSKLLHAFGLYFPNYDLEFLIRTDASHYAFGAVLLQILVVDGIKIYQPIAFGSYKFSEAAVRWDTHKKELYAIFYFITVKWSFYLTGKTFTIETDHANLRYMESSDNAMVTRWRIALQNFSFLLRHIPGRENEVADWLSRDVAMFNCFFDLDAFTDVDEVLMERTVDLVPDIPDKVYDLMRWEPDLMVLSPLEDTLSLINSDSLNDFFKSLHNARVGHWGPTRMFQNANRQMPGHGVPLRLFKEFVASCSFCQKERLDLNDRLIGIMKNKKVPNAYSAVGIDNVTITPKDINGMMGLCVIMNLYTHYVKLYPYATISAKHTTNSLIDFFSTIGVCDTIYSDLGSDYTSNMVSDLTKWLGSKHLFALVGRHQSNGVERQIKEVTRHLRYLVNEEAIKDIWSEPSVLCCIEYIINSAPHSENGTPSDNLSPYALTFGTLYLDKFKFSYKADMEFKSEHIKDLNENFRVLHEATSKFQRDLTLSRKKDHAASAHLNVGDLVLRYVKKPFRDAKLNCLNKGPYRVISIKENAIDVKHLAYGSITSIHIEELSIFAGTEEEAHELAHLDADHFYVMAIIEYLGDVTEPDSLFFKVLYKDNDVAYVQYEKDPSIAETYAFNSFTEKGNNELLIFKEIISSQQRNYMEMINLDKERIYFPGEEGLTKLRFFNHDWVIALSLYNENREDDLVRTSLLDLVKMTQKEHLIRYKILSIKRKKNKCEYEIGIPIFEKYSFIADNYWLHAFVLDYDSKKHLLIDYDTIHLYPTLKKAFKDKFLPGREVV